MSFHVSSNFLSDREHTNAQMATLGQQMKNLRLELKQHRVNAVESNPQTADPNQKWRQNATRFRNHCRTNGHTPSWCSKKMRDEELKRIENERTAEKKVTFTQHYNKKLEAETSNEETAAILKIDLGKIPPLNIRITLQGQTSHMGITTQNNGRSYDLRPNQSFNRSDRNRF